MLKLIAMIHDNMFMVPQREAHLNLVFTVFTRMCVCVCVCVCVCAHMHTHGGLVVPTQLNVTVPTPGP